MSSRSVQIIGGPDREHANVDGPTNSLQVKLTAGTLTNPLFVLSAVEIFPLSDSSLGQPIAVTGVTPVTLHTVPASKRDVVSIFASNTTNNDRTMTLRLGAGAGDELDVFLPANETVSVLHEIPLDATVVIDAALDAIGTVRVVGRIARRDV